MEKVCLKKKAQALQTGTKFLMARNNFMKVQYNNLEAKIGNIPRLQLKVNSRKLGVEVDTGAQRSIISTVDWTRIGRPPYDPTNMELILYNGKPISSLGQVALNIDFTEVPTYSQTNIATPRHSSSMEPT
uniref:Peptidase A2 domain-containing protein n=1 Tax=Acrobeloides nanus TaxID=290746 RepID=A0A914EM83_9BILA